MSQVDKQALREAAVAATQGGWDIDYPGDGFNSDDALIQRDAAWMIPICVVEGAHPESSFDECFQKEQQANAIYIAAANPAAMLAMLDENEALEKRIAELEAEQSNLEIMAQGVEKLITEDFAASIAGCLSDFDGMDEEILNQLIWSGNPPEPEGDVWCVEYMSRAYSIQRIIKNFAQKLRDAKS